MSRFARKIVFIAGGTSGIGLATAVAFAREGAAHVIVCGRTPEKWTQAQIYISQRLEASKRSVIEYRFCDIRVEPEVQQIIASIFEKYGRLDICFNNAGIATVMDSDITQSDWMTDITTDGSILYSLPAPQPTTDCPTCQLNPAMEEVPPSQQASTSLFRESPIATSAIGCFYCLKWELSYIYRYQPRNLPVAIINTASSVSIAPDSHLCIYSASKAFVLSLTKTVGTQAIQRSIKDGKAPIRINAISPGPIDTPLLRSAMDHSGNANSGSVNEQIEKTIRKVPMQRLGLPEEIAMTVLFLADETQSSYYVGANLSVDGGSTAAPV